MIQVRKIGTIRLSAGFYFVFIFVLVNHYGNISNIFSDPLEYTSKKTILCKTIREVQNLLPTPPNLRLWVFL